MPRIKKSGDTNVKLVKTSGIYEDERGRAFKLFAGDVRPAGLTLREETKAEQAEPTVSADGAAEAEEVATKAKRGKRAEPEAPENRAEQAPENR